MDWTLTDYLDLTTGGRFYWLRPRSLRARVKWYVVKLTKGGA